MKIEKYPYRACAWWGGVLVAQSDSCLCVEEAGQQSVLWFPPSDIHLDLFPDDGDRRSSDVLGTVELRSIASGSGAAVPDVLGILSDPAAAVPELAGHGAFDQSQVRIEVHDGRPGDAPRDVTVKRFPTWGDATHLIDLLDVRRDGGDLSFVSTAHSDGQRPVVEGSQMLAQSIIAAGRHAPDRRVVSANMVFLRAADARLPLRVELVELSAGRTFSTLEAQVLQAGRCCAAGMLLLNTPSPDVIRHAVDPPDVPGPYESPPYDMGVTGRDIRMVEGAYTGDPDAPVGRPVIDSWVRFRDVPDDPVLHAGLLAQFTGHIPIAAALRPHEGIGQDQAHRSLSTAINAISLSLHRDVRADRWMLYHHLSTFAGDGMTHSECRVHEEGGDLVASFTVDAMVRPVPAGAVGAMDERTAL